MILKIFRSDRFGSYAGNLIKLVLDINVANDFQIDLKEIIEKDSDAKTPILLCSSPGYDPSYKVEELAKSLNIRYITVAMGSQEGFMSANKAILQAGKSGIWVLLKNVHIAPS